MKAGFSRGRARGSPLLAFPGFLWCPGALCPHVIFYIAPLVKPFLSIGDLPRQGKNTRTPNPLDFLESWI